MKKLGSIILGAIAVISFSATANGQNKLKMEINYGVSAPLGSFKNYISKPSFRGATGELSYAINPKISVGLHSGYQSYYEKFDRAVYKTGPNETVSAVVSNAVEVVPFLVRGTYFPMGGSLSVQPYVSAAAGISLVNDAQYLGQFGGSDVSTPFTAQAGAGILIPFARSISQSGIKVGATYNYSAYNNNNITGLSAVGANAGVVFSLK